MEAPVRSVDPGSNIGLMREKVFPDGGMKNVGGYSGYSGEANGFLIVRFGPAA
jgi:hypothetical protein